MALQKVYQDAPEKWANFRVQVVLMVGASEKEEMEQFYIVNSTAKSVRTDLALDLLKQRADNDGRVLQQVDERGERWKIVGQSLAETLNEHSAVWKNRIRFPNAPKEETVIPSASFVNSLRGLIKSPFFGGLTTEQQTKLLDAY
ncbi:MAG: hypothetical protein FJX64_00305 [Alphaproteobacteria bacterium]|nr:hypothetical protein [Alphaproteobacteria bacterium]